MKRLIIALSTFFAATVIAQAQEAHVIVISVDGLRPEFYKDASWGMVNLRQGMARGAYSDGVRGVFPTVTYPSHTTILTGVKPLKHGIYYNTPVEATGITGRWYWSNDSVKVPTIWSAAKKAGLTTACVSWPVTVNAPITYNLPEVWNVPAKQGGDMERLAATAKSANPLGLFEEVEQYATGKLEESEYGLDYLSGDENLARIGGYLVRKYKPGFLAIHIANVDHFEHEQGRDGDKVRSAVASADRAIKTIMESVEKAGIADNTTIIVVGDHGFVNIHSQIAPNVLLAKAGLIDQNNKQAWKAYFHSSGGSSFLHLKDKNDKQTLAKVKEILASLPQADKKLFRVVDRAELDAIGADPNAALALAPIQGITFGTAMEGDLIRSAKGGTHGYFPDFKEIQTGFVAFGRGINKGVVIPEMGLEDIAPLIAKLLKIDFPSADGTLYPGLLMKQP
jgi:predicted AlkP superfamily pyrophosphatase or phosphodiesterase